MTGMLLHNRSPAAVQMRFAGSALLVNDCPPPGYPLDRAAYVEDSYFL